MGDSEHDVQWKIVSIGGWRTISGSTQVSAGWRIVSQREGHYTPLYHGMHRLICKLAWRYARQCMLDVEDLISEGYLALLGAQDKYDPNRASRSTFVYWVVRNHFWQLSRRWRWNEQLLESVSTDPRLILEEAHTFREQIGNLSAEAKDVVRLILNCPQELCEMARNGTPERLQKVLTKILITEGWVEERIQTVYREISLSLHKKLETLKFDSPEENK